MRLNYPLCLTGCHWYTNTPSSRQPGKITSAGPRVFLSLPPHPLALATICRPQQSELKPLLASFFSDADYEGREIHNTQLICVWGKGLIVRQADVHVFCVLALFSVLCLGLKRQWTTAWKPKQYMLCSELLQSYGMSGLMYSTYFTCVCELVKAHCLQVNVWWGNEALGKRNKNSRCSPSVPCDSSRQTLESVFLKVNTHSSSL